MDSKLCVPTDNIYKFYAIFGLSLIILSMILFVYTYNFHYERSVNYKIRIMQLESEDPLSKSAKKEVETLKFVLETDKANKNQYGTSIVILFFLGIGLSFYGFGKWHYKIQPLQDKLMILQVKKLEEETKARRFAVRRRG